MAISKHGIRTVAVAMSVVSLLSSASALACGGDWYPEVAIDPRIRGVAEAEKSLSRGEYVAAAGSVLRMMPHIASLQAKSDPLVARAERVLAVAVARSDGSLDLSQQVPTEFIAYWSGKTRAERDKSLSWSVSTLRAELTLEKNDPGLTTDLGEALSKVEGGQQEARSLLESLAARDLIASPEGYKALAELRLQNGDEAGQKVAMKRCESMATSSKVCGPSARFAG